MGNGRWGRMTERQCAMQGQGRGVIRQMKSRMQTQYMCQCLRLEHRYQLVAVYRLARKPRSPLLVLVEVRTLDHRRV